jgi:hypothetical protein
MAINLLIFILALLSSASAKFLTHSAEMIGIYLNTSSIVMEFSLSV